jgi:hypothetical protein
MRIELVGLLPEKTLKGKSFAISSAVDPAFSNSFCASHLFFHSSALLFEQKNSRSTSDDDHQSGYASGMVQ